MIALAPHSEADDFKNTAITRVREAGGKWYIKTHHGNVEIRPEIRGPRVIWHLVDAAGSLAGVDEDEVCFVFGDLP